MRYTQGTINEDSCISKDEKHLISLAADMMKEISLEDLLSYNVSQINFLMTIDEQ